MKNLSRYIYAVLAVPVAVLLRFALLPWAGPGTPFITLFPATVIVALLGGMGPAVLTGILGVLAADYFFIPPLYSVDFSVDFWARSAVVVLTSTFVGYVGEILRAARAKAEKQAVELRESQERLQVAQEAANAGTWEWDIRTNKNLWSGMIWKLYGLKPYSCEPSYAAWMQTIHPDDRAKAEKAVQEAIRNETELNTEWRVRGLDGEEHWLISRGKPFRDSNNKVVRYVGIAMDITERKRAEETLRKAHDELDTRVKERTAELGAMVLELQKQVVQRVKAEETVKAERKRFEDVLEMMPAYAVLLTPDYHVAYANRTFREWFGDDNGRKCYEFLFNRTEPCENCQTYNVIKTGKSQFWEWTGPNGKNYDIYDYPFADTDDSPLIMEIGVDVTAHKQAQEALRSTSLYARGLLEASLDPLDNNQSRKERLPT